MPKRTSTRRVDSTEVQGEGSYVELRRPKGRDIKAAMRKDAETADAEALAKYDASLELLRGHVMGWNWVDDDGEPLPQPQDGPDVFDDLTIQEIQFLTEHLVEAVESKT